jgi:outer membrane receptor protein involved in Fe transport
MISERLVSLVRIAGLLFLLMSTTHASSYAQTSAVAGIIEGTVTDQTGAVIPKASVTITETLTRQTRSVTTDERGFFRANQLPVGTYSLVAEFPLFQPYRQTGITLTLGATLHLDVVLPLAGADTITVTEQPSVLDPTQTAVVSSVDQDRIEELPMRSRNYLDFVLLAPGVSNAPSGSATSGATTPLAGSGFVFGGLRPQSNNVLIDGLDNNDEFTGSSRTEISPEIVQEFQVVNNGLSAESGGAAGGSIDVITRSGVNTIHGDAFIFVQNGALDARDPFETELDRPSLERYRAGVALGGPIVKNRTFYYAAGEQESNRGQIGSDISNAMAAAINSLLSNGGLPGLPTRQISNSFSPTARAETEAAARLDQQLPKSTSLMLRYTFTNNREAGDAFNTDGLLDASARGSSFLDDNSLSGSLTTLVGSRAVSDLRFQFATRHAVLRTAEPAGPEIDIAGLATFGRTYAGNSDRIENHYQADYGYSRTRSKHLWRAGAGVNRVRERADTPDGFGGVYLFETSADFLAGNASQFRQNFGNPQVDFPVTSLGAFVQDHWTATRQLSLDLGVRYDFEQLPAGFHEDADNLSPRIGAAWNPLAKLVLRAGYGVFFDRQVLASLTRAIQTNGVQGFEQVVDGAAAANLFVAAHGGSLAAPAPGVAPSVFRADPGLATPYSQQASAGAEYLLQKNLTARADYLFVRGSRLPRTLNLNLFSPVALTTANAASLGVSNPTPQQIGRDIFSPQRLNPRFDDLYQIEDSARSTYTGVSFTVSRSMNEDLELSGSYTLSKTTDDASNYDEQPQNPFDLAAERSPSRQDQQQRFVFSALWDLPIGEDEDSPRESRPETQSWLVQAFSHIEVAPIFSAESGRPVDPLTGVDSNLSDAFPLSSRPLGFGRNSLRTPPVISLDLRILKYFPFGPTRHLDVVAESFNLLNRSNVAAINPVFGSNLTPLAGFGQPTEGVGARQIQFSLDFEF